MNGVIPPLWTAPALQAATGGFWVAPPLPGWGAARIGYDLQSNVAGQICVLVHPQSWGQKRADPSATLPRLVAHGAAGLIVQDAHLAAWAQLGWPVPDTIPVLRVDNTFAALKALADTARARFRGRVFAVTGTVGKTTTREMIRHLTAAQGGATATRGNNNNRAGVLRTLANAPPGDAAVVVEMGFGPPVQAMARSSDDARPHIGLITTVSEAHLEALTPAMLAQASALEWVTRYKADVLAGLLPGGIAVLGRDHAMFAPLLALAQMRATRVVSFGADAGGDAALTAYAATATGATVGARIMGKDVRFDLTLPGQHMAVNALGALLAIAVAGFDLAQAVQDITGFTALKGRAQTTMISLATGGTACLINDSFNATPASMLSTLDLLTQTPTGPHGRRIAVLGDINRLGDAGPDLHRQLGAALLARPVDRLYAFGPLMQLAYAMQPVARQAAYAPANPLDLAAALSADLRDGDVITLKSSRGEAGATGALLERLVARLQNPMA